MKYVIWTDFQQNIYGDELITPVCFWGEGNWGSLDGAEIYPSVETAHYVIFKYRLAVDKPRVMFLNDARVLEVMDC